jgi:DNA-binding NtrC family response regulator
VLVIDDSESDRMFLRALLVPLYDVDSVGDGLAGIELVKRNRYGCLIVDLHLPVFGGEALVDYWEAMSPDVLRRLIIGAEFSSTAAGMEERVARVLRKPFDASELLDQIARCVAGN